jgi:uncharacterized membrane protein
MDYTYFKLIHLIAVVIFLGNIITGLFWMRLAVRTKDLKIISHTMNGIIVSDRWFTIPAVLVILVGGIASAMYANLPLLRTGWIFWSIVMFSISGIAFGIKVAPLQKKIFKLTSAVENPAAFDWQNFMKVYYSWDTWGLVALLTPVAAFVMMVLKVPA